MMDVFSAVKDRLSIRTVTEFYGLTFNRAKQALCPFHTEKTPSFSIKEDENYFQCFGCGASGDVIAFVEKLFNLSPLESAQKLAEDFNISIETTTKPKQTSSKSKQIADYVKACAKDIGLTDYFTKRGLNSDTIERFCLGYDKEKQAVVMPYNKQFTYYQTRSVLKKAFFKPPTELAGAEPLFNESALCDSQPTFVVESPICAITLSQYGVSCVAVCGTNGINKVVSLVKNKRIEKPLILCLDNDAPGKEATEKLATQLLKEEIPYIVVNIADKCKDINELHLKNSEMLKVNIETALLQAKNYKQRKKKGVLSLSELLSMDLPDTSWFVDGLLPEGLSIIAAPSKAGKSWMALQLAIDIASGGKFLEQQAHKNGVLYYALEDGEKRIKDRALKVLNGASPPENVFFSTTASPLDQGLMDEITKHITEKPNIKLIIIDTLQKVRGNCLRNESIYAYDYREMAVFKNYGMKHNVSFLLIHHLRKMNDSDSFNRISGSNGLMGAADSIFVMTKEKRDDEITNFDMTGRDISTETKQITFNQQNYHWELVGDAEAQVERRQRLSYESDYITKTIKHLVSKSPYFWQGDMTSFMQVCGEVFKYSLPYSPNKLASKINEYEVLLAIDGIIHTKPNKNGGRNGRKHTFENRNRIPIQQSLIEE